jgi:hypothetical protein
MIENGEWPCCICGSCKDIDLKQNPWGDLHMVCKPCYPKFVKHFWPGKEE